MAVSLCRLDSNTYMGHASLGPSGLQALPPPPREGWPRLDKRTFVEPQGPPREAAGLFFRQRRKKVGEGCSPVGRSRRWACLTLFTQITTNKVKQLFCPKMPLIHKRLCLCCVLIQTPIWNTECLTLFTQMTPNKVKQLCLSRDATNSQMVVSLWHIAINTYMEHASEGGVFNFFYTNKQKQFLVQRCH